MKEKFKKIFKIEDSYLNQRDSEKNTANVFTLNEKIQKKCL